jgi:hypothetical protein
VNTNPYAPPTAAVADVEIPATPRAEPPFFVVSTRKLVIMCLCTMGLYELYWFYSQWRRIKNRERTDISPPALVALDWFVAVPRACAGARESSQCDRDAITRPERTTDALEQGRGDHRRLSGTVGAPGYRLVEALTPACLAPSRELSPVA